MVCDTNALGALTSHLKGGTGMCSPQDPLFTPLPRFIRPPVKAQVRSQAPHLKENMTFPLQMHLFKENMTIFATEAQIWPQFLAKSLKILQKYLLKPLFLMKIRSQAPTFIAIYLLTSPKFGNPYSTYQGKKKKKKKKKKKTPPGKNDTKSSSETGEQINKVYICDVSLVNIGWWSINRVITLYTTARVDLLLADDGRGGR